MEPRWCQDGAKMAKKSKNYIHPKNRWEALIRGPPFWPKMWPTWPQLGSQNGAQIDKNRSKTPIKMLMLLGVGFWSVFGGFWEAKRSRVGPKLHSFCFPKSIKIASKIDLERHQKFDGFLHRFFIDFDSILGAKFEPCWPPRRPQDAPGRRRDAPGAPREAAKTPQEALRGPKTPPRSIFDGFLMDF